MFCVCCVTLMRTGEMGPPCKQRSQLENWSETLEEHSESSTVTNRWDPVVWYSQHGYNVSEMITAPGNKIIEIRSKSPSRLLQLN